MPPPRLVESLEAGAIDGFCAGEPWGSKARWLEREPETHRAALRALLHAARWCDAPEHRAELAQLLAAKRYVDVPEGTLGLVRGGLPALPRRARELPVALARDVDRDPDAALGPAREAARHSRGRRGVYRADLYRAAAAEPGIAAPNADEKCEWIDSERFDPARTAEYASGADSVESQSSEPRYVELLAPLLA